MLSGGGPVGSAPVGSGPIGGVDNRLEVPGDENQDDLTVVRLHYIRGGQVVLVHALRTDIDDFAQQRLPATAQNDLIRRNLETVEPIIEGKVVRGEVGQWTNPTSAQVLPFIELTGADLEQGLGRHRVTVQQTVAAEVLAQAGTAPVGVGSPTPRDPVTSLQFHLTPPFATLSPALSGQDRAELSGRLEAVEARLRELLPVVKALQTSRPEGARLGHNNPPDDEPPMSPADIELGAAAIVSMRLELSLPQQRLDVFDVAGKVLAGTGRSVLALSKWIGERGTVFVDAMLKAAGTALVTTAFLHELHIDLSAVATTILSHLH